MDINIAVSGEQEDHENGWGRANSASRATTRLPRHRGGGGDDEGRLRGDSTGRLKNRDDGSDEEELNVAGGGGGAGVDACDTSGECPVQPLAKASSVGPSLSFL